jgi:hypothetical protein
VAPDWRALAACAAATRAGTARLDDWFPTRSSAGGDGSGGYATATAICTSCPVCEARLEEALRTEDVLAGEPATTSLRAVCSAAGRRLAS